MREGSDVKLMNSLLLVGHNGLATIITVVAVADTFVFVKSFV